MDLRPAPFGRHPALGKGVSVVLGRLLCLCGLHRRSRKRVFRDADGLTKSKCMRCGIRMVRERRTGRWLAHGGRDARLWSDAIGGAMNRMTGPLLFLIVLAALLGLAFWMQG